MQQKQAPSLRDVLAKTLQGRKYLVKDRLTGEEKMMTAAQVEQM